MSPALLLLAGATLGVALFLVGLRTGSRLSRSHLVSANAVMKAATSVSAVASEAASRAAQDSALAERMTTFSSRLELLQNRLLQIEETSEKTLSILKLEYLGDRDPVHRRPTASTELPLPKSEMPRITLDGGWGHPKTAGSRNSPIDPGLAEPVRPM